jgi:hypothetical protein
MTIGGKVESAFSQLITNLALSGLGVYVGVDNDVKDDGPAAIVTIQGVTEEFPEGGVMQARTILTVLGFAADMDKEAFDEVANRIFAAALDPNVTDTLKGLVSPFDVYGVFRESEDEDIREDAWIRSLTLNVVCTHGGN